MDNFLIAVRVNQNSANSEKSSTTLIEVLTVHVSPVYDIVVKRILTGFPVIENLVSPLISVER